MKKKLEADLVSIAHRVLKNHNREDIAQLQKEALNLYEKLSILKFYEDHFEPAKPTIGKAELEEAIEAYSNTISTASFTEQPATTNVAENEEITVNENYNFEQIEPVTEIVNEAVAHNLVDETIDKIEHFIESEPEIEADVLNEVFEENTVTITETSEDVMVSEDETNTTVTESNSIFNTTQPTLIDQLNKTQNTTDLFSENLFAEIEDENTIQTSFVNLFGEGVQNLEFVKVENKEENKKTQNEQQNISEEKNVNNLYNNTITLGLNDRIAFQNHLFNDSDQDLNRVISQLNTMNNLNEALDFIENMVKPDYNDWENKQEYEERFMALVQKRFS